MPAGPAFSLRPAVEADFEPVLALSIRAMRVHLERIGRFDPDRRRTRMRRQFDAGILRVIEQGGGMAGCVGVDAAAAEVEIHSLFLDDHAQGRGLGAAVFHALLAEFPGRPFRIEVLKQSPRPPLLGTPRLRAGRRDRVRLADGASHHPTPR